MITLEEFVERIVRLGDDRAPRSFPRATRDREILMKSITLELDEKRTYSEREVNEHLKRWQREIAPAIESDHVTLRRTLVDYGHLERTRDGKVYRRDHFQISRTLRAMIVPQKQFVDTGIGKFWRVTQTPVIPVVSLGNFRGTLGDDGL